METKPTRSGSLETLVFLVSDEIYYTHDPGLSQLAGSHWSKAGGRTWVDQYHGVRMKSRTVLNGMIIGEHMPHMSLSENTGRMFPAYPNFSKMAEMRDCTR